MLCHWRYVLDNLFGDVESVTLPRRDAHPEALGRERQALQDRRRRRRLRDVPARGRRRSRRSTSSWCTRVRRDDLVTFQVDGTHGSAVAGLHELLDPGAGEHAAAGVESRRAADRSSSSSTWEEVPGHRRLRQRLQDRSGRCSSATSVDGRAVASGPARRRQGRAARRARPARAGSERRWIDVPALKV